MRETNFAFPAQNRACVCITSQLYDRRALDTTSPLPLVNSLTHLTYLTSTSPRIREIMTADGGLERLVRMLHDFCMCPPPPENPAAIYGLAPPASRPLKLTPTLNPVSFDKHAAYRFSLAFQCVVNIGVRGSESIRRRVVQAGTLEVVGCILEAWLANKGFAVGPAASATGLPRESREQRLARRQAQQEQRTVENLTRALQRSQAVLQQEIAPLDISRENTVVPDTSSASLLDISSVEATPARSSAHTTTRDRSGTIVASEHQQQRQRLDRERRSPPSTDNSRPETETEDDDVDMRDSREASGNSSPSGHSPAEELTNTARPRRQVTIVSDSEPEAEPPVRTNLNADAHIIINAALDLGPDGGVLNVDDGITGLDNNDDFAMGAPPGAPGAIDNPPTIRGAPDITPRAGTVNLPPLPVTAPAVPTPQPPPSARNHHNRESSPYRDEDVLLSLQLLAYLSKYPHVRQYFYKQRASFHPASLELEVPNKNGSATAAAAAASKARSEAKERETSSSIGREGAIGFLKSFASTSGRGKEKEKAGGSSSSGSSTPFSANTTVTNRSSPAAIAAIPTETRKTNVFSLVERFTFRPSSSEADLPNPPPKLPGDIQYWASVIMRNACRKDDSRGGIRQCANMLCGKWESYPREFAKCRRCRKAKYCGKECQSSAWSEGHRFWCSARDGDEEAGDQSQAQAGPPAPPTGTDEPDAPSAVSTTGITAAGAAGTVRARHRQPHPHIGTSVASAAPTQHQHTHGDHQHYHHNAGGTRGTGVDVFPQPLPTEILVATLFPNTNQQQQQQQQRSIASRRLPAGTEAPLLYLASPPPSARASSHRAGQPEADTSRNTGMIPVPYAVYTSQAARGAAAAGGSRTAAASTTSTSSQETVRTDNGSVMSQTTPTQMQSRSNNPPFLDDDSGAMRGMMMDHDMSVS